MKRTPKSEEILGSLPGSPRYRVRVNRMDCSLLNSLLWMREPEGINPLLATPVCPLDQPEANTPKQARRRAFVYSFTAWEGATLPPAQQFPICQSYNLQSIFTCPHNHVKVISRILNKSEWFMRLQNQYAKDGVSDFDETGFTWATNKPPMMVTQAERLTIRCSSRTIKVAFQGQIFRLKTRW